MNLVKLTMWWWCDDVNCDLFYQIHKRNENTTGGEGGRGERREKMKRNEWERRKKKRKEEKEGEREKIDRKKEEGSK